MAWCWTGNKPLPEPIMTQFSDTYMSPVHNKKFYAKQIMQFLLCNQFTSLAYIDVMLFHNVVQLNTVVDKDQKTSIHFSIFHFNKVVYVIFIWYNIKGWHFPIYTTWTNISLNENSLMTFTMPTDIMPLLVFVYKHLFIFIIPPFEKRTYYAMAMSVRPSVLPSVRVFRTFFQHALRYQFETWYMHSVGGTTCRVWVSSQLGHFDLVYSQK